MNEIRFLKGFRRHLHYQRFRLNIMDIVHLLKVKRCPFSRDCSTCKMSKDPSCVTRCKDFYFSKEVPYFIRHIDDTLAEKMIQVVKEVLKN